MSSKKDKPTPNAGPVVAPDPLEALMAPGGAAAPLDALEAGPGAVAEEPRLDPPKTTPDPKLDAGVKVAEPSAKVARVWLIKNSLTLAHQGQFIKLKAGDLLYEKDYGAAVVQQFAKSGADLTLVEGES